jgi:hypothetical protein
MEKIKINIRQKNNIKQILRFLKKEKDVQNTCLNNMKNKWQIMRLSECWNCCKINPEKKGEYFFKCPCTIEIISKKTHIKRLTKVLNQNPNI